LALLQEGILRGRIRFPAFRIACKAVQAESGKKKKKKKNKKKKNKKKKKKKKKHDLIN